MTAEEISQFLEDEELISVTFRTELAGSGFILNTEEGDANIPENYKGNIPFFVAKSLSDLYKDDPTKFILVDESQWLENMRPGGIIELDRSYQSAANVATLIYKINENEIESYCDEILERINQVIIERTPQLLSSCLKMKQKMFEGVQKETFTVDEKVIIEVSRNSIESFYNWKASGSSGVKQQIPRRM